MSKSPESFFEFDHRTAGRDTLATLDSARELIERQLGKKLPPLYPLSLWMTTFMVSGGLTPTIDFEKPKPTVREELILPNDPEKEASYWLGFKPYNSHRLRDALLVRITDRPQSFMGIAEHPKINEIVRELRGVYDRRRIDIRRLLLEIPISDFAFGWSSRQSRAFDVVDPKEGTNIAADFDAIFRRYNAVEELFEKGSKYLSNLVNSELSVQLSSA